MSRRACAPQSKGGSDVDEYFDATSGQHAFAETFARPDADCVGRCRQIFKVAHWERPLRKRSPLILKIVLRSSRHAAAYENASGAKARQGQYSREIWADTFPPISGGGNDRTRSCFLSRGVFLAEQAMLRTWKTVCGLFGD